MTFALLLAGIGALALGGFAAGFRVTFTAGLAMQAAGAAVLAVAGFAILAAGDSIGAGFGNAFSPRLGVDGLSAFFLATLGLVAAPALVFSQRYLAPTAAGRAIGALVSAFMLSLALVLCARDPLTFLLGWELMTLLPALVILIARSADSQSRQTVFAYVSITHIGSAGTWIAVLLLAQAAAIGNPAAIESGSVIQTVIALTTLIGMGTKAGLMPLHVWLPRAHPIAPAPVSALMSGVMIKVAVYGLVRVLVEWLGAPPQWLGLVLLALGAASAVGGVTYAIFQHDLKRLLAFHSIENVGIIVLGIAACLLLRRAGLDSWAAFALAAALLHTLNHAVFKSLLFLGAGAFERAVGSLEIDRLGGLLGRMRWTGFAFLVGAMAIAGLPPLNGFASEWLTLQSLLHVVSSGGVGGGLAGAAALAALAATAALAVLCFVKVVGLVLLGHPRRRAIDDASEAPAPMVAALVFLAAACVVLGVVPGLLFGTLVGLAPWAASAPPDLALRLPGTGSLPTLGVALALVAFVSAYFVLRGRRQAAPTPTWACGQPLHPRLNWTSAGFSKPLRIVLETVLRPSSEVSVRSSRGVAQEVSYSGEVPHLIEDRLYSPLYRRSLGLARQVRRLQSGSLATYVSYLMALVVTLLLGARIGWIG